MFCINRLQWVSSRLGLYHIQLTISIWHLFIEVEWCIYASLNQAIIGSNNGLSPTIIWTSAGLLLIGPLETSFSDIWTNKTILLQKSIFQYVVCKVAAIVPQLQRVFVFGGLYLYFHLYLIRFLLLYLKLWKMNLYLIKRIWTQPLMAYRVEYSTLTFYCVTSHSCCTI